MPGAGVPTTQPTDILAPRSDAGGWKKVVLLQTKGPDPLAPSTRPATAGGTLTADERYGIIEGKPVPVANQPTVQPSPTPTARYG